MVRVVPVSCWRKSWVLRAMRAEKSVSSVSASSSALVCSDWVCPCVAAIASMAVRTTLLNTSCAVSDQPEVWQWVRSDSERGSSGAQLGDLHEVVHADREEKRQPWREAVDGEAGAKPGAHILDAVGEGVGEFQVCRRARLLHVIAGDRDRVELRHPLRREGEDIGNDP